MRITFFNQKGGVGKTTLCVLLGAVLKEAGYEVAIDDRDPQQSAAFLAQNVFNIPTTREKPNAKYIITDTPGHLKVDGGVAEDMKHLIKITDKSILITEKSIISVHASYAMARLLQQEAKSAGKVYLLFNKVRSSTTVGKQSEKDIAKDINIPLLKTTIPLSASYENSQAEGLQAVAGQYRDKLLALALEIMK